MNPRIFVASLVVGLVVIGSGEFVAAASLKARGQPTERDTIGKRDENATTALQPKLDLNEASAEALSTLPGIGPKRARAIVAYRERHRFARTRELRRIRGIGPKTFQRLQAHVTVGNGPTSRGAVPSASGREARGAPRR
ncbi:MAG: helix-hairpin-helix domain-containing protein [Deltaproteobacteria bacterium]|nr:helix-hairpin-helix domain-containing protein [Deltaproteobacteria bacterium]